jgi:iron complex transport system substrate-binding protein
VQRVISLAPSVTEIVFALGQGHRLVGVTSYCTYPAEAKRLPKCGAAMDTDLEKILSLRPDLILIHGQHGTAARLCKENNIRMLRTSANDLPTLYDAILTIGDALGCTPRAEQLVDKMKADLDKVRSAVKNTPKVKVFLCMSRQPGRVKSLLTTNGEGFVSRMLEAAGGENIFANTDVLYPKIGVAELIRRGPDAIIEMRPGDSLTDADRQRAIADWAELGPIAAVANKRIYVVADDFALIPGPRIPLLARRFAELLHPDVKGRFE